MKENTLLLRRNSVQNLFNGYYYDSTIAAIAGSKLNAIAQDPQQPKVDKTEGMLFQWISYFNYSVFNIIFRKCKVWSKKYQHFWNYN